MSVYRYEKYLGLVRGFIHKWKVNTDVLEVSL